MPKDTSSTKDHKQDSSGLTRPTPRYLPLVYADRPPIPILRDADYQKSIILAQEAISELKDMSPVNLGLRSTSIPGCEGVATDIPENLWASMHELIKTVEVFDRTVQTSDVIMHFYVETSGFIVQTYHYDLKPSTLVNVLKQKVARDHSYDRAGLGPDNINLTYAGNALADNSKSLAYYGLRTGATLLLVEPEGLGAVEAVPRFRVRKPVIYIYSPTPRMEVSVNLTLSDSWSLSAVWPCTPFIQRVGNSYGQVAEWLVSVNPDGTLKDKHTGIDVTYLYWEALANVKPLSPQVTGLDSTAEYFDPAKPSLSSVNSVLLPVSKVGHYLDKALSALALNAEARTSFITFWLPDMLKSPYIALRFVPQEQYARAAQLDISPKPDVATRVFMLFRGVNEDDVSYWTPAAQRAEDDVSFWKAVVGIDEIAARDETVFRVLEWGGMEV